MHSAPRPVGPRSIRSSSPLPQLDLQPTRPLQIRRPSEHSGSSLAPSTSPPPASISPVPVRHRIGGSGASSNGRPSLKLSLTEKDSQNTEYYAGPPNMPLELQESPELKTVRPMLRISTPRQEEVNTELNEIMAGIQKINVHGSRSNSDASSHTSNGADSPKDEIHQGQPLEWSDDVLIQLSRLGEGNGGAVFKVQDKRTGKVMARKTITAREAPPQQLKRELTISSIANHPNIIRFFGTYVSPSSSEVNVLMEYGQGGSLAAISERIKARNGRIGEKVAGRIAEGVLSGLAYLHSLKTIHRDIKPSNILLTAEGVVKLCDFGVSGELVRSIVNTFTGTSLYMAPERIRGQSYSIRADVWSTGLTLLEIVQNQYPFPEDLTSIELLVYITNGEPPQLSDDEDVRWSDEMKDFVRQTLTIDANDRPTPRDMLSHPWIINIMKGEVRMARWISEVWGWTNKTPKVTGS